MSSTIVEDQLSGLYQSMFQAKQSGDHSTAESLMIVIEKIRNELREQVDPALIERLTPYLPEFALSVLGKSQSEIGKAERSNCINAAFNYHDLKAHWEIYSTIDFLNRIKTDFVQITPNDEYNVGDFIVLWTRTGGSWDNRLIDVLQMNQSSPEFPYGLVFDHIVVRLTSDMVFHKPDPTPESRYQIEPLKSVMSVTSRQRGFEMTFHRRKANAV